ncbi:YacL family protein [Thalassotalea sp. M1531]|uniref:YacL family protein n=1 Tax=Thalassotalea algicola TaxID=2716224 RepID=A0A7Y0L9G1_9GAMM|nr:YacL family protein [Thalassotalea algicola]NMP30089.1 YacL family protein [Thalassotalea algicola]
MEYEFRNDPTSGQAKALFSLEQQMIGPWLEVEVGQNTEMLSALLVAIEKIENQHQHEITVTGSEYSVTFTHDDVFVQPNTNLNGIEDMPEELISEQLNIDSQAISACGLDDFRQILLSWAKFTKN